MEREVVSKICYWLHFCSYQWLCCLVDDALGDEMAGGKVGLTTLGSQLWFIYTRSLFRFKCSSRPFCTVAYVGFSASVHGGKESLA